MQTPIENIAALTIGTVESVSPSEIKVLLETDAPQATALNTGAPTGFPRINGYVLIPNETGAVVGMIVWLGVERSAFPKRTGMKDFGMVDLPFSSRKLTLTPLGTLVKRSGKDTYGYVLRRGVSAFPSVGDPVLLPTAAQLKSIIEAAEPEDRRVMIGTSPLAGDAKVTVDPNKIFGRHLAVLGNTGSGKSCSVAGIIRWSLEQANKERKEEKSKAKANARFIILDPNGEYSSAFEDFKEDVRRFRVPPIEEGFFPLTVPAWMWNSHEWCAFTRAAPAAQKPILLQALRELRAGGRLREPVDASISRTFGTYRASIALARAIGAKAYSDFPGRNDIGFRLRRITDDAQHYLPQCDKQMSDALSSLSKHCTTLANQRDSSYDKDGKKIEQYQPFAEKDLVDTILAIDGVLTKIPAKACIAMPSDDSPIPFDLGVFAERLEQIATERNAIQHMDTLIMRVRMLLNDGLLSPILTSDDPTSIDEWLKQFIGESNSPQLSIIDLSLVPSDVLHTIIAVVARLVFEAVQRYKRLNGKELPTIIILEEAHSFIMRGQQDNENIPTPEQMCRETFERIAREGRKFGLGLVLSSQRPSELSPTAIAQCNTFLLHRIVNDRDQELVGRLVPDNLGGLLKELPSLPSRQAILLGWASPIPVLVEVTELPENQRPKSADPKFWEVWTGVEERRVDWTKIVDDWIGKGAGES